MSSNIANTPFSDQDVALQNLPIKPISYSNKENEMPFPSDKSKLIDSGFTEKTTKDPLSLVTTDTQIKALYLLYNVFPKKMKAAEIADKIFVHRSTVSTNVNDLIEIGLIDKSIVRGTENHVNPTLLFYISSHYKEKIKEFLDSKEKFNPDIFKGILDDSFESVNNEANEDDLSPSFEEQVKTVLVQLTQKISVMQEEIDQLKKRLDEKPKPKTDLSDVFSMINALDINKK